MVDEAHAKGFESGKAAAEAQLAGKLEERDALHRKELAAAREAWTREESGQPRRAAREGPAGSRGTIGRHHGARPASRFSAREMHRRAIADLVESLTRSADAGAGRQPSASPGRGRSSGGAARAARRQARQCHLSPGRALRRARDGRANRAGNASRRVDGADRGGDGDERRRRRQVARARHHPPPGERRTRAATTAACGRSPTPTS